MGIRRIAEHKALFVTALVGAVLLIGCWEAFVELKMTVERHGGRSSLLFGVPVLLDVILIEAAAVVAVTASLIASHRSWSIVLRGFALASWIGIAVNVVLVMWFLSSGGILLV